MDIGKEIRQARKNARLSQDELGKMVGVNGSAISKYENGKLNVSEKKLFEIAEAIKYARKNAGLTQEQLAKMVGVSKPTICRYETSGVKIPTYNLEKISNALCLSGLTQVILEEPINVSGLSSDLEAMKNICFSLLIHIEKLENDLQKKEALERDKFVPTEGEL